MYYNCQILWVYSNMFRVFHLHLNIFQISGRLLISSWNCTVPLHYLAWFAILYKTPFWDLFTKNIHPKICTQYEKHNKFEFISYLHCKKVLVPFQLHQKTFSKQNIQFLFEINLKRITFTKRKKKFPFASNSSMYFGCFLITNIQVNFE